MDPANSVCQECGTKASEVFCKCSVPEVTLCTGCLGRHTVKNPRKDHTTRPISELSYYKIPGYFKRLDIRIASLPEVKNQALKSIGEVDRALNEYAVAVDGVLSVYKDKVDMDVQELQQRIAQILFTADSVVHDIQAKADEEIAQLQQIKIDLIREVHEALEEVERTLAEDNPLLTFHYSPVLRNFTEAFQPFCLFSFHIHTSAQLEVTLTIRTGVLELVQATATFLRFFNCHTSAWGPQVNLQTPIQADSCSTWTALDDGLFFCSGGCIAYAGSYETYWSVAYLLSPDGAVDPLPNMSTARWGHGVIQVLHVYVFGGRKL